MFKSLALLSVCPSWSKGSRLGRDIFVCESSNPSADTFYPHSAIGQRVRLLSGRFCKFTSLMFLHLFFIHSQLFLFFFISQGFKSQCGYSGHSFCEYGEIGYHAMLTPLRFRVRSPILAGALINPIVLTI